MGRDNFTKDNRDRIAARVGYLCSAPACRVLTVGATEDGSSELRVGMAAHICAAAPGGPRYDAAMTSEERAATSNGIWLCYTHGKAVDSDPGHFTIEMLRKWKRDAEKDAWQRVAAGGGLPHVPSGDGGHVSARFRMAAEADFAVYRKGDSWPATAVELRLRIDGIDEPASPTAIATAVRTLDDLILVAPPGMGKTTVFFQLAEALLAQAGGIPLIVALGDWATQGIGLVDAILARPAFTGLSQLDFKGLSAGAVLLLDGWNELDAGARERLRVELKTLKAANPALGLLLSTRQQIRDVPFRGKRIELLPLDDEQQLAIARAMRGDDGARIVDQAWRTPGLNELVLIPLYLVALLQLPAEGAFPETREEVLRRFVDVHEADARRAEALASDAKGFQQDYLEGIAVAAIPTANTVLSDSDARRAISGVQRILFDDGQIAVRPEPTEILGSLVANHVLTRSADAQGIAFQHQQFQEWFASHAVERQIRQIGDAAEREHLKAAMFDLPPWEEAILFAVERMARGPAADQALCARAVVAAFGVDPMLAAEMIDRATDAVWALAGPEIAPKVRRWHQPGTSDRAQRFMMNSARPEFLDILWPMITDAKQQRSLTALRNCRRFRPKLLGPDAARRIAALGADPRATLLHEIIFYSGMDGLDLALKVAKRDPDPDVRLQAAEAFAFRRADRHLGALLATGGDGLYDGLATNALLDDVSDPVIRAGLVAARGRQKTGTLAAYDRLYAIIYGRGDGDRVSEVADIVAVMTDDEINGPAGQLLFASREHHEAGLAAGMLRRLRAGRSLCYGTDDILAAADFALDDEEMIALALRGTGDNDDHAEAAASVLGAEGAGQMIAAYLDVKAKVRGDDGSFYQLRSDRANVLRRRIGHLRASSLLAAIAAREAKAGDAELAALAAMIARHPDEDGWSGSRPFDAAGRAAITAFAQSWGTRLLASQDAERAHLAAIAKLAARGGDVTLLPRLRRLLDENLSRFRALRAAAIAANWQGKAGTEASMPMMHEYQRAFLAIDAPETAAMMTDYLGDIHFGDLAARVLAARWASANEPKQDKRFASRFDFGQVAARRAARAADPGASSAEADAIFAVIEPLVAGEPSSEDAMHAVALGIVAARLPHGGHEATIERLIALATPLARRDLLHRYVLSGGIPDTAIIAEGISAILVEAAGKPWMLMDGQDHDLREWVRLLPFTSRPEEALDIVRALPDHWRHPGSLEEFVGRLAAVPSPEAERQLFALAEEDPRFYGRHSWQDAVFTLESESAARRLIDLVVSGALPKSFDTDRRLVLHLGARLAEFPSVRAHICALIRAADTDAPPLALLHAVGERPDINAVLLLVDIEARFGKPCAGRRVIEPLVTERVAAENWGGAYETLPVAAPELRRALLPLTSDGGPADAAARCLCAIDDIRDEHGNPVAEPRHPHLASGRSWPIISKASH